MSESGWWESRTPVGGGWELVAWTNSPMAARAIGAVPLAKCGCPLRIDGTDPHLHRDGCTQQGELQVERGLSEERRN
jgi:hypothetical protein